MGGRVADNSTVIKNVVDPWHFDSVAYVAVALLSDVTDMVGGELQIVRHRKDEAMRRIAETGNNLPPEEIETVSYEAAGKCILAQGSLMVHRVTRVQQARENRLSLVMAFQPANPFRPDKTVLDTWERFDADTGVAPFEFFRAKAHSMGHALTELAKQMGVANKRENLATYLRDVAAELQRSANLLDKSGSDYIGFV